MLSLALPNKDNLLLIKSNNTISKKKENFELGLPSYCSKCRAF